MPDFNIYDDGHIALITPLNQSAQEWTEINVPDRLTFGDSFACERRYTEELTIGMIDEGFLVHVNDREIFAD